MTIVTLTVIRAMAATRAWYSDRFESERGASAVEYALLVGLIAAVIAGAVLALGGNVSNIFKNTSNCVATTTSAACP